MRINLNSIDSVSKIEDRIRILSDVIIFSESNEKILQRLASSLIDVFVQTNEAVFHKGDQLNAMYIIVKGSVKVHDGEHVFTQFGESDFFGEYSLIDSSVRSATVTAIEETHLLRLDQEDFHKIIESNVEVSKAVLKALIKRLRNNNILEERLTQNSIKIKQQRDELDKQKRELEELNATKDKFFTIIAHDLKNPFNSVIGLAELLIERYDTYDSNKIKEFITQIHKFSSNTYNLLEDLLQWAKSQTGKLEVKLEKVDIKELVAENIFLYKEKAFEKGVQINSKINGGLYALIDKHMISTVIRNLISNSVKFTRQGDEIAVETKLVDDVIEISVADTGVGISKENVEKIFQIDSNISTQGTAEESGTGLGLIISREFIEKNGGTINVKSKEGHRTKFTFTVPIYNA
ncbi:ATP-binding protein [Bacteroidota bacterium]